MYDIKDPNQTSKDEKSDVWDLNIWTKTGWD